jgi:hypothetical protein
VLARARALVACLATLALAGCADRSERAIELRDALASLAAPPPAPDAERPGAGRGERRPSEPATFIDGELRGVLRFHELPRGLPVRWKTGDDGRKLRRYGLADYLAALGQDLAKIREVHLYGARGRVSILVGDELRAHRDDMLFSFTQGDRGKPRAHYPPMSQIRVSTFVDAIEDVAVYVAREPPTYEVRTHAVRLPDGSLARGIPYAAPERPHGTRVYVDGALTLWAKRRSLPPETPEGRHALAALLAPAGIDLAVAHSLTLVTGDDVARALDRQALSAQAASLAFTMPPKARGYLSMALDGAEPAPVAALLVETRPPSHGSALDHASAENGAKAASGRMARAVLKSR